MTTLTAAWLLVQIVRGGNVEPVAVFDQEAACEVMRVTDQVGLRCVPIAFMKTKKG